MAERLTSAAASAGEALPPPELEAALAPHFAALRAFIDRRIAELSAELAATVQLLGLSEQAIIARLTAITAKSPASPPHRRGRSEARAVSHSRR